MVQTHSGRGYEARNAQSVPAGGGVSEYLAGIRIVVANGDDENAWWVDGDGNALWSINYGDGGSNAYGGSDGNRNAYFGHKSSFSRRDVDDGSIVWSKSVSGVNGIDGAKDHVYLCDGDDAVQYTKEGVENWRVTPDGFSVKFLIVDKSDTYIYAHTSDKIHRLDPADGSVMWTTIPKSDRQLADAATTTNGPVYVAGGTDGPARILSDGTVDWSIGEDALFESDDIAAGTMAVDSTDTYIYHQNSATGDIEKRDTADGSLVNSSATSVGGGGGVGYTSQFGENGLIYIIAGGSGGSGVGSAVYEVDPDDLSETVFFSGAGGGEIVNVWKGT